MCGHFMLYSNSEAISAHFGLWLPAGRCGD